MPVVAVVAGLLAVQVLGVLAILQLRQPDNTTKLAMPEPGSSPTVTLAPTPDPGPQFTSPITTTEPWAPSDQATTSRSPQQTASQDAADAPAPSSATGAASLPATLRATGVTSVNVLPGTMNPAPADVAALVSDSVWTFDKSGGFTWSNGRGSGPDSTLTGTYVSHGSWWDFAASGHEVLPRAVKDVTLKGAVAREGTGFRVTMTKLTTAVVQVPLGSGSVASTMAFQVVLSAEPQ